MKLSSSKDEKLCEIKLASELIKNANFSRISFALNIRSSGFLERVNRLISRYTSSILREYSPKERVFSCSTHFLLVSPKRLTLDSSLKTYPDDFAHAELISCTPISAEVSGLLFGIPPIYFYFYEDIAIIVLYFSP